MAFLEEQLRKSARLLKVQVKGLICAKPGRVKAGTGEEEFMVILEPLCDFQYKTNFI